MRSPFRLNYWTRQPYALRTLVLPRKASGAEGLIGWWFGVPPKSETTSKRPPPGRFRDQSCHRMASSNHIALPLWPAFPSAFYSLHTALCTFLAAPPFTTFN